MQNRYLSDVITVDPVNDIEHHGVLGMKWGIRRFQPYSLIPRKSGKGGKVVGAAKKRSKSKKTTVSSKSSNKKIAEIKKSRNQKSAEAKAAVEKQAKTARQRKEELEKVVNSGDAKLVYEHKSELTKKQLDTAIERINTEAKLKSLVSYQNPGKLEQIKDFAKKVDDINSVVKTGVNVYRTVNEIQGISKSIKDANTNAEKVAASAKALKELADGGATAEKFLKLQSQLSDSDLRKARSRVEQTSKIHSIAREDNERAKSIDEKHQKEFADAVSTAKDDLNKYGLDYARKKTLRDLGSDNEYSRKARDKIIGQAVRENMEALEDSQAANRHQSQEAYKTLQEKRKRTGKINTYKR